MLKADIARCYPSIYTHSLPWAIHTKPVAKRQRGPTLWGNELDRLIRNCQDGQTSGIPIGPDTSLTISEIVLCAIDALITKNLPTLAGFRYVDDYELAFATRSDAEEGLAYLQECLGEYELALNADKTEIVELPYRLIEPWVFELRRFDFGATQWAHINRLEEYFSLAFVLSKQYKSASVLGFAIQRLRDVKIHQKSWSLVEALLLQCSVVEPGCISYVLNFLQVVRTQGYQLSVDQIEATLNQIISRQSPQGYGSEVAWALWGLIVFKRPLSPKAATALAQSREPIVALLVLDALSRGLIPGGINTTNWEDSQYPDELRDSRWLLSYEANIKKWLPRKSGHDHTASDQEFGFLKSNHVAFYDRSLSKSANPFGAVFKNNLLEQPYP